MQNRAAVWAIRFDNENAGHDRLIREVALESGGSLMVTFFDAYRRVVAVKLSRTFVDQQAADIGAAEA